MGIENILGGFGGSTISNIGSKILSVLVTVFWAVVIFIPIGIGLYMGIRKKKFPMKVFLDIKRSEGWITKRCIGSVFRDEKGIEYFMLVQRFGKGSGIKIRQVPPSDYILPDNTVHIAQIGLGNYIYLKKSIDIKIDRKVENGLLNEKITIGKGEVSFDALDPNLKYATLYELKRADTVTRAGSEKIKQIATVAGLILIFLTIVITTYMMYKNMQWGVASDVAKSNTEVAKTNLETTLANQQILEQLKLIVQDLGS